MGSRLEAHQVPPVLLYELLGCGQHDLRSPAALAASRAEREAHRCTEDTDDHHLKAGTCLAAALAARPERATVGHLVSHHASVAGRGAAGSPRLPRGPLALLVRQLRDKWAIAPRR